MSLLINNNGRYIDEKLFMFVNFIAVKLIKIANFILAMIYEDGNFLTHLHS